MENMCTVFGPGAQTPSVRWLSRSPQHRLLLLFSSRSGKFVCFQYSKTASRRVRRHPSHSPPQSSSPACSRAATPGCKVGSEPPRQWGSLAVQYGELSPAGMVWFGLNLAPCMSLPVCCNQKGCKTNWGGNRWWWCGSGNMELEATSWICYIFSFPFPFHPCNPPHSLFLHCLSRTQLVKAGIFSSHLAVKHGAYTVINHITSLLLCSAIQMSTTLRRFLRCRQTSIILFC